METDPRSHVRPGDKLRIAAEQINWINRQMAADTSFGGGPLAGVEPGKNVILARNNTGGDVPRWGVMAIGGVEIDPTAGDTQRRSFEEQPCITGTMPSATTGAAFCIAVEPIKAGKIGRVAVAGVVQAKITVGSGVTGDRARPHASRDTLELAANGPARVLWRPSGSGTVWGLVRIGDGGDPIRIGKVGADWAFGTCATVTLWEGAASSGASCAPTQSSPTATITDVRNLTRGIVPSGLWVTIGKAFDDNWYLIDAASGLRIGKTSSTGTWTKGTLANITLWEGGTPQAPAVGGGTINNVANLWGDVPANRWVGITDALRGAYYLVVAEC
jgi:hypothetical protein